MYGAAAATLVFLRACSAIACQPLRRPSKPEICTWEATPRMRARSSFWKPFITDSTTINAMTPTAMPTIDAMEMNEMK